MDVITATRAADMRRKGSGIGARNDVRCAPASCRTSPNTIDTTVSAATPTLRKECSWTRRSSPRLRRRGPSRNPPPRARPPWSSWSPPRRWKRNRSRSNRKRKRSPWTRNPRPFPWTKKTRPSPWNSKRSPPRSSRRNQGSERSLKHERKRKSQGRSPPHRSRSRPSSAPKSGRPRNPFSWTSARPTVSILAVRKNSFANGCTATPTPEVVTGRPPTIPTVKVEHPCPTCGRALTYIQQYNRWYCYSCRAYAPKTRSKFACPTCGAALRWIPQYERWWCDACRKYAPSDLPKQERTSIVGTSAAAVARGASVAAATIVHRHRSPGSGIGLVGFGMVLFVLYEVLVDLPVALSTGTASLLAPDVAFGLRFFAFVFVAVGAIMGLYAVRDRR